MFELIFSDVSLTISGVLALTLLLMFLIDRHKYNKYSQISLKNRHVVITGGSSGIGEALAEEVLKRGANVTLVARDQTKLDQAKQRLSKHFLFPIQRIFTLSLDVTGCYEEIVKGLELSELECGPVFMLVNCAGRAICGKLEDLTPTEIQTLMDLNYRGSILMSKAVLEGMKEREEGHIVLTSSAAGLLGIYGYSAYSASKFALRGLAETLSMETVCHGIKITIAYPPDTDTPGFAVEEQGKPKETSLISESGGLYQPSTVAQQILKDALAGKFSSYVGLEGFFLVTLTAGMTPPFSFFQLFYEMFLLGILRIVAYCYLFSFNRIIQRCMVERNKSKKAE